MEWLPSLDSDEHDELLNDFELRKVKDLKRSLRNFPEGPGRTRIKIEILKIYKSAAQRINDENKKYVIDKLWNEMLQEAFNRQARINSALLVTLMASGLITIFFVIWSVIASPNEVNLSIISVVINASTLMAIVSIVVGVVQYTKMKELKKQFNNGDLLQLEGGKGNGE